MARPKDAVTPRIDEVVLGPLADGVLGDLEAGAALDGLRFEGVELAGDLERLVLEGCALEQCAAEGARLDRARLLDCVVTRLTAPTLRAALATLRDVRIEASRIGAAELFDGEWQRVVVEASRVDYLNLSGCRLEDVRLTDCTIGDLDLRGCTVQRMALSGCRIGTLSLAEARLTALDLRGAELEALDGAASLAGAMLAEEQLPRFAPLLAEALGIVVG
ncbi:MAG: pentapeptide repeat-containing protein [Amnibacterium sp.]